MSQPSHSEDVEAKPNVPEFLPGFADFAEFIASDEHGDLAIFRRFDTLSARNLLYLQGQLLFLEGKLKKIDNDDTQIVETGSRGQQANVLQVARDWESFERKAGVTDSRDERKMKIVLEIREVMKEYQEALLRQSEVLKLRAPPASILRGFSEWFERKRPFRGDGEHLLRNERDMIALRSDAGQDRLSLLLRRFGFLIKENRSLPPSWGKILYFPEARVTWIVSFISVVLAAALLVGAIVSLNFVTSANTRLALLAIFTTLFAVAVGLLTNARRAEVFASTAAYAAVLVVFIASGNLSGKASGAN